MSNIGKPSYSPADLEVLANPIAYEVRIFNLGWNVLTEMSGTEEGKAEAIVMRDELRKEGFRAAVYCCGLLKSRGNQEGVCIIS